MNSTVVLPPTTSWLGHIACSSSDGSLPLWLTTTIACGLILLIARSWSNKQPYPVINPPRWFQPNILQQIDFVKNGLQTLSNGRTLFPDKPYRMVTHMGDVTVLPPSFATIIRNEEDLDLRSLLAKVMDSNLPIRHNLTNWVNSRISTATYPVLNPLVLLQDSYMASCTNISTRI